jgi:hypothetical protein
VEGFWDVDDPSPFYLAEEIETPITDWPGLRAYWAGNERLHARISLRLSDIRVRTLSEGLVQGVLRMDWDIAFLSGPSRAMGGDNRSRPPSPRHPVVAPDQLGRGPAGAHHYMRRLYEGRVTPLRRGARQGAHLMNAHSAVSAISEADERAMLDAINRWIEKKVAPVAMQLEHDDEYPHALVEDMKELGLFGP